MTGQAISLREQAQEVELHCLGLRDLLHRAEAKEIKRPPEWIERARTRVTAAEAALRTLNDSANETRNQNAQGSLL